MLNHPPCTPELELGRSVMCCAYIADNQQGCSHLACPECASCIAVSRARTAANWNAVQCATDSCGQRRTWQTDVHQRQLLRCAAGPLCVLLQTEGVSAAHALPKPACCWGGRGICCQQATLLGACMYQRHWWGPKSLLSLLHSVLHVVAAAVPRAPPVALMHVPPRCPPVCVRLPVAAPACMPCVPLHTGCPSRGWT